MIYEIESNIPLPEEIKVVTVCKRGNVAERDRFGHCLCIDCVKFRAETQKKRGVTLKKKEWILKNKTKISEYTKKWVSNNREQLES